MTDTDKMRVMLEAITRRVAAEIRPTLDFLKSHGVGVTIFAFTFDAGAIAYISTAEREGMIKAVKEWIAYQEAGLTTEPRGERGRT